jgi:Pectate lyase superfamily protein
MTVYSFDLLATLKAFTTASTNDGAMLAGCVSIGDDGGGEFIFGPSPTNRHPSAASLVTFTISSPTVTSGVLSFTCPTQSWTNGSLYAVYLSDAGTATGAWVITPTSTTSFKIMNGTFTIAPTLGPSKLLSYVSLTVTAHALPIAIQRIAVSGVPLALPRTDLAGSVDLNATWDNATAMDANTLTLPVNAATGTYTPGAKAVVGDDAIYVPATDANGTVGGLWRRTNFDGVYNVRFFGAKGDNATNDVPAITSAIQAAGNYASYDKTKLSGAVVYLPPGVYKCTTPLIVTRSIVLRGAHSGSLGSSLLNFAKDIKAPGLLQINGALADYTVVEHLDIVQDPTATPTDPFAMTVGVYVRNQGVTLRNLYVSGIQGDGIVFDGTLPGNANCWTMDGNIDVRGCTRHGVVTQYDNGNAGSLNGTLSLVQNGAYALYEHSFLGNSYSGIIHTAGNGVIVFGGQWTRIGLAVPASGIWNSGKTVTLGQLMLPTIPHRSGYQYQATSVSGPTGGTEPTWSTTLGATMPADGGVVWNVVMPEGGILHQEGGGNASSYTQFYAENGQNPAFIETGTATTPNDITFSVDPRSFRNVTGFSGSLLLPLTVYSARSQTYDNGATVRPLVIGLGDPADSNVAFTKRADAGYPTLKDVPTHWLSDAGPVVDRWDGDPSSPSSLRWRTEVRQCRLDWHSYTQVGGRGAPQPGAMCFPSLWLGNKTGVERRLGAVPSLAAAPYLPDLTSLDVSGGGGWEQGDILFNAPKSGRLNWPAAWRARARNSVLSEVTWAPIYHFAGEVLPVGASNWRARNSGYSAVGTTFTLPGPVIDGEVTWDAYGTDASQWDPLISESPTMLTKSVAGSGTVTLTEDESAHSSFKLTGTLTGEVTVIVAPGPAAAWTRTFINATTGAFRLTIKTTSGGSGIDVPQGTARMLNGDGTDILAIFMGEPAFNPASLSLTGWWRSYGGSSPWSGSTSASSSSSNALTEATHPPSAGAVQNGKTTANFNGTNSKLTGAAMSTYFSSTAFSGWVLVNIDAIHTSGLTLPANSNDQILCSHGTGVWSLILNATGPAVTHYISDAGGANHGATTPLATGTWQLVQFRFDATNVGIRVNGNAWVQSACPSIFSVTPTIDVGMNVNADHFLDGRIVEVGLASTKLSEADFENVRTYINDRYGLAL